MLTLEPEETPVLVCTTAPSTRQTTVSESPSASVGVTVSVCVAPSGPVQLAVTGAGHETAGGVFVTTVMVVEHCVCWKARAVAEKEVTREPAWPAVGVQLKVLLTPVGP